VTTIHLPINVRNPGEYLAVCGLIEVIARHDHNATSCWGHTDGLVPELPPAWVDICVVEANIDESYIAKTLARALGDPSAWSAVTESGRVPLPKAKGEWVAGLEMKMEEHEPIIIDHWYERAFVKDGSIVQKQGTREGKSRWKFWAGQHEAIGAAGLVLELIELAAGIKQPNRLQELLHYRVRGSSGLKLDPATTRSALDRGISANDASDNGLEGVRPALELLAAIGISSFFPPRRYGDAAPDGAVGVIKRTFRYCTWQPAAPLCIARLLARGVDLAPFALTINEAAIGMMGQYSYLKSARAVGLTEIVAGVDQSTEGGESDE
jgi:CRISPR-associated protein Csb3